MAHSYLVLTALENFGSYLMDGFGGVSAAGARLAAEELGLPEWYRPLFLRNLGTFLFHLQKAKKNHGRQ